MKAKVGDLDERIRDTERSFVSGLRQSVLVSELRKAAEDYDELDKVWKRRKSRVDVVKRKMPMVGRKKSTISFAKPCRDRAALESVKPGRAKKRVEEEVEVKY